MTLRLVRKLYKGSQTPQMIMKLNFVLTNSKWQIIKEANAHRI